MLRETISIRTGVLLVCSVLPVYAQEPATPAAANVGGAATVTGSGTPQFVPLWRTTTSLGNSGIFQKGSRLGIGTKAPGAQLDVRALTLIPAFSALGASAPPGSDQNASAGISSKGGDADPDSGLSVGGAGVVGKGGASSLFAGSAGSGGSFTGGSGGTSSAFGGAGVVGTGGASSSGAGPGGVFTGGSGSGGDGIDASCTGTGCFAGNFTGNVNVTGSITAGKKDFKIDDPLDPANKYLLHASVESSEMKNIYDGTVILDAKGQAVVQLPDWFEAVNGNFRYQLTALGAPSPGLYIAQKISNNRFKIAGGAPGVEVSWQVTGIRQDAYAKADPMVVEQEKNPQERGYYIHPELYGAPEEKSIEWARNPAWRMQVQELRAKQLAQARNAAASASPSASRTENAELGQYPKGLR